MIRILIFAALFFMLQPSKAQSLYKDITRNKVTLVQKEQTLVFFYKEKDKATEKLDDKNYFWYGGGQLNHNYGGHSGKLLHGTFNAFYPKKNLKETGEFRNGLKKGQWKNWDSNGQLMEVATWRKGKKNGNFHEYNEAGKISRTGKYKDDKLNGTIKVYHSADSIKTEHYKNGMLKLKKVKVKNPDSRLRKIKKNIGDRLKFRKKEKNT